MDQGQVQHTAEHMHAILKGGGFKFDFKDLLTRLENAGVPDAASALQKIVDNAIFPWLSDTFKAAGQSNFMYLAGIPMVAGLEMAVDPQLQAFLQSLPGQAQQQPS